MIDDDPTARDLMATYLTDEGFAVETAANGVYGLRRAHELRPAAIILDIRMPDIDGWTVLAALKSEPELADIFHRFAGHRLSEEYRRPDRRLAGPSLVTLDLKTFTTTEVDVIAKFGAQLIRRLL